MAPEYLYKLHELIRSRLEEAEAAHQTTEQNEIKAFQEGRIEVLTELRAFLAESYHLKLPRRLRSQFPQPGEP